MSSIKQHLENILNETTALLNEHTSSPDEFLAVDEIEQHVNRMQLAVHEARKVFERTKDIEEEKKR